MDAGQLRFCHSSRPKGEGEGSLFTFVQWMPARPLGLVRRNVTICGQLGGYVPLLMVAGWTQAIQVLGGEVSQFMADPRKGFTEEVQAAGKAISLFSIAQVRRCSLLNFETAFLHSSGGILSSKQLGGFLRSAGDLLAVCASVFHPSGTRGDAYCPSGGGGSAPRWEWCSC